jgi:unconventional prefoldin RPB5 interactor 1
VQKQIDQLEQKIAQIQIISEPDIKNEEGLSVMDIQEELDEEGNIMNAWVNGKDPMAAVRTLDPEALLKLGKAVGDLEKIKKKQEASKSAEATATAPMELDTTPSAEALAPSETKPKAEPAKLPSPPAKAPSPMEVDSTPVKEVVSDEEEDKEEEGGGYVRVINDPDEPVPEDWIKEVPEESEEERKLRREMLQYNMSDIGAVVAELNLEEDGDYYGYEDYSDYDMDEDEEYSEEEDKYGRTTQHVVSDSYRKQMEELEERLTGKPPRSKLAAAATAQAEEAKPAEPAKGKKGVRFSEELDIAPAPSVSKPEPAAKVISGEAADEIDFAPDENDALPFLEKLLEKQEIKNAGPTPVVPIPPAPMEKPKSKVSLFKREKMAPSPLRQMEVHEEMKEPPAKAEQPVKETVQEKVVPTSTLSESVMERTPGAPTAPIMPPAPPKKLSRFAAARAAKAEPAPEPEEPKLMANTVVERTPPAAAKVKPPSEYDTDIHRQEVAMQFHKLRSKMIHQEGGFMERDEDRAVVPLDEDGEKVKVSRFKAARLKGMGGGMGQ